MELYNRIKEIVCKYSLLDADVNELCDDTDLISDLGINSIGLIQIFIELEEELEIEIDGDFDFSAMSKLSNLYNVVEKICNNKATTLE